jgi:hypothetical protein
MSPRGLQEFMEEVGRPNAPKKKRVARMNAAALAAIQPLNYVKTSTLKRTESMVVEPPTPPPPPPTTPRRVARMHTRRLPATRSRGVNMESLLERLEDLEKARDEGYMVSYPRGFQRYYG